MLIHDKVLELVAQGLSSCVDPDAGSLDGEGYASGVCSRPLMIDLIQAIGGPCCAGSPLVTIPYLVPLLLPIGLASAVPLVVRVPSVPSLKVSFDAPRAKLSFDASSGLCTCISDIFHSRSSKGRAVLKPVEAGTAGPFVPTVYTAVGS